MHSLVLVFLIKFTGINKWHFFFHNMTHITSVINSILKMDSPCSAVGAYIGTHHDPRVLSIAPVLLSVCVN